MKRNSIAVIGGSGLENLFDKPCESVLETPYGSSAPLTVAKVADKRVIFLPRHGLNHSIPPHKVNYRANIHALYHQGVTRIFATNAVGAISTAFQPGEIAVPHDFVDLTKTRDSTFYDTAPVTHIDVSSPFCPELRKSLIETSHKLGLHVHEKAVMVCTEGPRLETPAEIRMFRLLGCDIVGMTSYPEAVLARELEICYSSICYISNMAAGMQERLSTLELAKISKQTMPRVAGLLTETIKALSLERKRTCPCANALEDARFH